MPFWNERKAMAMALVDRSLRARELGEDITAPAQDEEFVISHSDNVQATGFVEHLNASLRLLLLPRRGGPSLSASGTRTSLAPIRRSVAPAPAPLPQDDLRDRMEQLERQNQQYQQSQYQAALNTSFGILKQNNLPILNLLLL